MQCLINKTKLITQGLKYQLLSRINRTMLLQAQLLNLTRSKHLSGGLDPHHQIRAAWIRLELPYSINNLEPLFSSNTSEVWTLKGTGSSNLKHSLCLKRHKDRTKVQLCFKLPLDKDNLIRSSEVSWACKAKLRHKLVKNKQTHLLDSQDRATVKSLRL
jgi:hypothetical protein